jgi:hypothetical protein
MLQSLRDWGGKLAGAAARLAGIYHMALQAGRDDVETEIELTTVTLAIELAKCLISHAQAVFALMDKDPALNDAEKLVAWMIRQDKTIADILIMMDDEPRWRSSSDTLHALTVALVKPGRSA